MTENFTIGEVIDQLGDGFNKLPKRKQLEIVEKLTSNMKKRLEEVQGKSEGELIVDESKNPVKPPPESNPKKENPPEKTLGTACRKLICAPIRIGAWIFGWILGVIRFLLDLITVKTVVVVSSFFSTVMFIILLLYTFLCWGGPAAGAGPKNAGGIPIVETRGACWILWKIAYPTTALFLAWIATLILIMAGTLANYAVCKPAKFACGWYVDMLRQGFEQCKFTICRRSKVVKSKK